MSVRFSRKKQNEKIAKIRHRRVTGKKEVKEVGRRDKKMASFFSGVNDIKTQRAAKSGAASIYEKKLSAR